MQRLFVALLDADLADVVGAPVVGALVFLPVVHRGLLALVDAADVADHVRAHLAVRVGAKQPRPDFHAGKAVALRREARHLFVAQAGADGQGVEAARILAQALEATAVPGRHFEQLAQLVDDGGDVAHLRRRDLQRVGRVVGRQHHAVAVQDLPAVGNHGNDRGAIALGPVRQRFMAHHLQVDQPRADQSESEQHRATDHHHAAAKKSELGGGIADFIHRAKRGGERSGEAR
ncbi:hypothetical protein D3C87_1427820 [compost metagenome]